MTDTECLLTHNPTATPAQIEAFCERVAIMLCYATLTENEARSMAYENSGD